MVRCQQQRRYINRLERGAPQSVYTVYFCKAGLPTQGCVGCGLQASGPEEALGHNNDSTRFVEEPMAESAFGVVQANSFKKPRDTGGGVSLRV